jgi:nitrite reductase/ring-hydroxylating ferredoxin subunit
LRGFIDRCPHMDQTLTPEGRVLLTPDGSLILCGRHGAVFDPLSGLCLGGPCAGESLTPWPVETRDGLIVTS